MGRFYKTASASPLDYMHKINAPLMDRALQFNDQAISAQTDQGIAIGNAALNFKRLADDDPDAAIIAKQYNDQVEQLSKTMAADPANWRKQQEPLRALKKDILDNYTTGPIAKMQANYGAYQAWKTKIDKAVEKGTIDPNTAKVYEDHYLGNWRKNGTGTGFKNGRYNVLRMDDVMANRNITKELSEGVAKLKADGTIKESITQPGMYMIKTTHGEESVSPDRVLSLAMANMSPELQQYLKSRQQVGLMRGMYGEDGNMITPYSKGVSPELLDRASKIISSTRTTNPKEADRLQAELDGYTKANAESLNWNPNSGLAPILKGIVDSNSWMKTADKIDVKADPIKLPVWLQGRREAQQELGRGVTRRGQDIGNENADARLEWEKEKFKLGQEAKAAAGTAKGKTATAKVADMFAKEYMGDIASPDHNFADDITSFNRGDLSAVNRVQEAVKTAKEAALKSITFKGSTKDLAEGYIGSLTSGSYKASTSDRIKTYIDELSANYPLDKEADNARRYYLTATLKKLGDNFNTKINDWYSTANADITKADITSFTPEAKVALANTMNSTPEYYFSIDDKGNQIPLSTGKSGTTALGKIVSVDGGTAGNVQGKLGYRATFENGDSKWIFPSEDENVYNINKNIMLQSLQDKNSVLAVNLKDEMTNNIRTALTQGRVVQGGKQNIIDIGGHKLPAVLFSDGSVMLKDADGNDLWEKPVSSIARLVDLMTASKPESTKK